MPIGTPPKLDGDKSDDKKNDAAADKDAPKDDGAAEPEKKDE
jgi:hypothetical protein